MAEPTLSTIESSGEPSVHGPKALFWFLTMFFSLGITAFSTGGLWFQCINKFFPLEVIGGMVQPSFNQEALKWADASLIVAAPVFFLFAWLVRRALGNNSLSPKNKVRAWITYIILFLSISIAIGDLITTVFFVLNGDFTVRFILKSLSILTIVIWIFVYYWLEIRSIQSLIKTTIPKTFAIISAMVIGASFIGSFFIADSPALARSKAYDQTRINNLQDIRNAIDNFGQSHNNKLPNELAELKTFDVYLPLNDPKTNQPYEYTVNGDTYQLCATFETSNQDAAGQVQPYYYGPASFAHGIGRTCFNFSLTILNVPAKPAAPVPVTK